MSDTILQRIDFEKIRILLQSYFESTGFVVAILDLEGNVLARSDWQKICGDFHRANPNACRKCRESDTVLAGKMKSGENYSIYKCLNGLIDVVAPIKINDRHVANIYTGQVLFDEPDRKFFIEQAEAYGFDKEEYLAALDLVPIVSEESLKRVMGFLANLTLQISESTMQKVEQDRLILQTRKSEENFRKLFENSPFGIMICRMMMDERGKPTDFIHLEANPSASVHLGMELSDLLGRKATEIADKETSEHFIQLYGEVVRTGTPANNLEHYFSHHDRTLQVTAFPLENDLFILNFTDITERRRALDELKVSEAKLKSIIENSTNLFYSHTADGEITYISPQVRDYLGYEPEEVMKRWTEFITDSPINRTAIENTRNAIRTGKRQPTYELEMRRKDGRKIIVEVREAPVVVDGTATGVVGSLVDITEHKKAAEERNLVLTKYSTLFGSIPVGITVTDKHGNIIESNKTAEALLGLSREAHEQRSIDGKEWELIRPDGTPWPADELPAVIALREKRLVENREMGVIKPDSTTVWLNVSAIPIPIEGMGVLIAYSDMTEWKTAQQQLKTNENRYRKAQSIGRVGNWEYDLETTHFWGSEEAKRIYGFDPEDEEFTTEAVESCIPDRETVHQALVDLIEREKPYDLEFEIINRATGETRFIQSIAILEKDERGNAAKVSGVILDITERKSIQVALAKRVKELDCLHHVARLVENPDATPQDIFQGTADLIPQAYDKPDLTRARITLSDSSYLSEGFQETAYMQHADIIVRGKKAGCIEVFLPEDPAGGTVSTLHEEQQLLETLAERLGGVTERLQSEADHERLMLAIGQAGEAVVITDTEGTIEYVNPAFEKTTGYPREEAIGRNPRILKSGEHDGEFYREMWGTLERGETWSGRLVNRNKNGELFTEEAVISPVRDETGQTVNYVAVKRDISHQLHLEAQLNQAQKMEAVGRLAGGVAHDFNNMLSLIIGHAEMAMEEMEPTREIYASLGEIKRAGERSADLTRQLLAFARKQTVAPKVIDMNKAVASMIRMLERLIGEDIELAWQPGEALWLLNIDPGQVDQILANLCVNARDAIADIGKVVIETGNTTIDEAYCKAHPEASPGEYVMMAVSDNGCGMDIKSVDTIFEPFYTTKEPGKGTGLGLATVYGIVKQNQGFINVNSEPDRGSTFRIYLPRHHDEKVAMPGKGPDVPTARGHETVLLVEDEPSILKMTTRILEVEGYAVVAAGTPGEAIRLAKEHAGDIHLLMTDVIMPEMNGRDLARNIMPLYPYLKCLFMSGYTSNVIAHHGVLDEGVNFISKPFSRDELAGKLRAVLDRVH